MAGGFFRLRCSIMYCNGRGHRCALGARKNKSTVFYVCLCMHVCLSFCLVCLPCLPALSACLVCLPALSVYLPCLSTCLVCLPVCASAFLPGCQLVRLLVCLSVCPSALSCLLGMTLLCFSYCSIFYGGLLMHHLYKLMTLQ